MMFFNFHSEKAIAYKELSNADLGLGSSHQTHIGLKEKILTFLTQKTELQDSLLLYDHTCEILPLYFDYIENPNSSLRSPKIRKGTREESLLYGNQSVVKSIREISEKEADQKWYLLWFGLDTRQPVFLLFKKFSSEYNDINSLVEIRRQAIITETDEPRLFKILSNYLNNYLEKESEEIFETVLTENETNKKIITNYKTIDLANSFFKEIGDLGEDLVNNYFTKQKQSKEIDNFTWYNKSKESYLPYDFTLKNNNGEIIYLDVKTTTKEFERKIYMSNSEIEFVSSDNFNNEYNIYRIYEINKIKNSGILRICKEPKSYIKDISYNLNLFKEKILPLNCFMTNSTFNFNPTNIVNLSDPIPIKK